VSALEAARAQAIARAGRHTRDRDGARAHARALAREVAQARDREHEIAQACDHARGQVHDRMVALDLAQAYDRDHILGLVRGFDRTCTLARARILSYALDLDNALARSFSDALTHGPADDPAGHRGLDLARDLARDSALARAHGRELDRDSVFALTVALSEAADRHVLWRSLSEPLLGIFDGAFGSLLGQIFSMRFMDNPAPAGGSTARRSVSWTAVLTEAFTVAAGESAGHIAADPATLEAMLHESVKRLVTTLKKPADIPLATWWPAVVAERLQAGAGPFFARTERPTAGKATASRLAALCLASEADEMERTDIGDMFRQLAAGITLLERRATDQWPASEIIMLALDQSPFDMPASLGD
jgi:hypothetical protein